MTRFLIVGATVLMLGGSALDASAQWHGGFHVSVGVGWYPFYSPWYPWYPFQVGFGWYPGPYPYYPYYPYGFPIDTSASVRVETKQRDADVYVDGYLAGKVNDYDGVFQRLRVEPGPHELVVYHDGFHAYAEHLYLAPTSDQHLKFELLPLAPGEAPDPRPVPQARREGTPDEDQPRPRYGRGGPPPQLSPQQLPPEQPGQPPPDRGGPPPTDMRPDARAFGSLSLGIQPLDAEILIDGEKWSVPTGQSRVVIQLLEGKHHVEVQKDGYARYVEDVGIMRGRTLTLNVSLVK